MYNGIFLGETLRTRFTYEEANAWGKAHGAVFHLVDGEPRVTAFGKTVAFSLSRSHESAVVEAVLELKNLLER